MPNHCSNEIGTINYSVCFFLGKVPQTDARKLAITDFRLSWRHNMLLLSAINCLSERPACLLRLFPLFAQLDRE
jgi:hypothetical protein